MRNSWDIEFTEAFGAWWSGLPAAAKEAIAHDVELLGTLGPALGRPWVDSVKGSRHANMKELRTRHRTSAFRVLFAFDPRRTAVLLLGGDKSGDRRFYARMIRAADDLLDQHLDNLHGRGSRP